MKLILLTEAQRLYYSAKPGEAVEVPDAAAEDLLAQGIAMKADEPKPKTEKKPEVASVEVPQNAAVRTGRAKGRGKKK